MERVFCEWDATSEYALKQLAEAIEAVPIRTLKYTKQKGSVYLVKYHEFTGESYLYRLPSNLIRLLISYNSVLELLSLTMTCKRFSKFLFDKYISFKGDTVSEGFYSISQFSYQHHYDLVRIAEIQNCAKRPKVYATTRPELTTVLSVNKSMFLAYFQSEILEGSLVRYNDSMEIRNRRPCIPSSEVFDCCGETVVCGNRREFAISFPDGQLRTQSFSTDDELISIKFLSERRLILMQKANTIDVYQSTMQLVSSVRHEGYLSAFRTQSQSVFATMSQAFITIYAVSATGEIRRQFQWKSDICVSPPVDFAMHRESVGETHCDFLFILLRSGRLLANNRPIGKSEWVHFRVAEGRVVAGDRKYVFVFQFLPQEKKYKSIMRFAASYSFPLDFVSYSRMKSVALFRTETGYRLTYYRPSRCTVTPFCSLELPPMEKVSVTESGEFLIIRGEINVQFMEQNWNVPGVFIVSFNSNSMRTGDPDLTTEARELIERKAAEMEQKKLRRLTQKLQDRTERIHRQEVRDQSHRPKH